MIAFHGLIQSLCLDAVKGGQITVQHDLDAPDGEDAGFDGVVGEMGRNGLRDGEVVPESDRDGLFARLVCGRCFHGGDFIRRNHGQQTESHFRSDTRNDSWKVQGKYVDGRGCPFPQAGNLPLAFHSRGRGRMPHLRKWVMLA